MNTSVFYKNEQSENEKSPTMKRLEEMPDPEEWFSNEKSTKIIETSKEKQDLEDKVKKMEEYIKQLEAKKKSEEENVKSFIPVVRKRNILKNEQTETKPGVVNLEDGEDGMPAFLKGVEQILTGLGVDYCAIPEGIKKHVVNDDDTDAIVNKKCLILFLGLLLVVALLVLVVATITGILFSKTASPAPEVQPSYTVL